MYFIFRMEELPKKKKKRTVKNNQIGEAALWSSFFHPLLIKILSDNDRDIRLRWPDKAASEKGQGRPDVIISKVTNGEFGASLGFGECKTSHKYRTASLCKDVIKLTQLSQ